MSFLEVLRVNGEDIVEHWLLDVFVELSGVVNMPPIHSSVAERKLLLMRVLGLSSRCSEAS